MAFGMTLGASAAEPVYTLTDTPPREEIMIPYGSHPPASNADVHNLTISAYNYQAVEVTRAVYTSKWLTGAASMKITVRNFRSVNGYGGLPDRVEIEVYQKGNTLNPVKTATVMLGGGGTAGDVTILGLSSNTEYCVKFIVRFNDDAYAFNGSISLP